MLTVKELQDKLPGVDIGELKDGVRYVVRLPGKNISVDQLAYAREIIKRYGLNALVIPGDVELFEIKAEVLEVED